MPYLILNTDNSIKDVLPEDSGDLIFITDTQMAPIIENTFGHYCFDYINGEVVLNATRNDDMILEREKIQLIDKMIEEEKTKMAKERLSVPISSVMNATTKQQLNAMKGIK